METDSPVVYHGTSESRFPPEEIKKSQIQLSQEELRILRECNRESFYYRCLPFALAGMAATFLAVKNGFLKSHPRWGPAGKMSGAAAIGWFIGKMSYRTICEDKFLKISDSAVGDAIRKRRGYSSETFEREDRSRKFSDENITLKDNNYTTFGNDDYHSSSGSLNLDVDKNVSYSGLDDWERPTTDRDVDYSGENEPNRKYTSYEELRRKNREQYEQRHNRQYQPKSESLASKGSQRQWDQQRNDVQSKPFSKGTFDGDSRNVYGDSWDNPKFP